jgi:hypothetical protein
MANVFRRLINRVTGRGGDNTPSDGNGKGSGGSREPKRGGGGRKSRTQKVKEAVARGRERVKNFVRNIFRRR